MISLLNNQKQIKMKNESNLTDKMVAVTNIVEERSINEIISELKSHSDFIHSEIFLWSNVLNVMNDVLLDEMGKRGFRKLNIKDLMENQKENIEDQIRNVVTYGYDYFNPYPINVKFNQNGLLTFEFE